MVMYVFRRAQQLNPDKSKVILFGNSNKSEFLKSNMNIVINGSNLSFVDM